MDCAGRYITYQKRDVVSTGWSFIILCKNNAYIIKQYIEENTFNDHAGPPILPLQFFMGIYEKKKYEKYMKSNV